MATPASPVPAEPASPSNPLLGVFFSPGPTMEDLIRRPRFLPALLVMMVIGAAVMTIGMQRGVMEHFMRRKMENNPRMEQLPAAQRERIIEQTVKFSSYGFVGGAVIGPVAGLLLTSAYFLFIANILLAAKARYIQLMAIVSHAWLPNALVALVGIPILLAKEPDAVDLQNIVPLANLSFLFDSSEHPKLYAVGAGIDLFSLWIIGLLGIGISRLTGKPKAVVLPTIVIPWLLYVLVVKPLQA